MKPAPPFCFTTFSMGAEYDRRKEETLFSPFWTEL
jgi:hypothetical protein